jgi:hypothetical protein
LVLVIEQGAAAHLAYDEVEHPRVPEVRGDDPSPVAVVVRAGKVAHVEEVAAAGVEVDAVPLEGAQVVPLVDDPPRIADPELVELGIECARLFHIAVPVAGL